MTMIDDQNPITLTDEQLKSRRSRNIAIAVVLGGLVVMFYVLTWAKLGAAILNRAI